MRAALKQDQVTVASDSVGIEKPSRRVHADSAIAHERNRAVRRLQSDLTLHR